MTHLLSIDVPVSLNKYSCLPTPPDYAPTHTHTHSMESHEDGKHHSDASHQMEALLLAKHFEESRQTVKLKEDGALAGLLKTLPFSTGAGALPTNLLECPRKKEREERSAGI